MADQIWGRERELAAAERFLDAAAGGPAVLVLEGAPGIGKTALWSAVVTTAATRRYHVLACKPAKPESQLAFSALTDLFGEVSEEQLEALPGPQRHALEVALLRTDPQGVAADQRSVAMATLAIVRSLAARTPVVLAVDDWQWVDPASSRVLTFTLRRLTQQCVATLITLRSDEPARASLALDRDVPEERKQRLLLGPLSLAVLHRLIADRLGMVLPRPLLVRLEQASDGNPFFALEIASTIARSGSFPRAGEPLPIPESLLQAVAIRLSDLRPPTLAVLAVVAAAPHATLELVRGIAGEKATRRLKEALAARVVQIDGSGRIRFSHPLLAAAVSASMAQDDRSRLHRRLAKLTEDVEARARHILAAGATVEDLPTIEAGARRAWSRGSPEVAAELAERALALQRPDNTGVCDRQIEAARYHFAAGDAGRARALLEDAVAGAQTAPERANVLWWLGRVRWHADGAHAAIPIFREALAGVPDPALRAGIERDLALSLINAGQVPEAAPHAGAAMELAEGLGDPALVNEALGAVALVEFFSGNGLRSELLARAREDLPANDLPVGMRPNVLLAAILKWSDQFEAARQRLETERRRAEERGAEQDLPGLLWSMSELEGWTGHWTLAARYAEAGVQAATLSNSQPGLALTLYARTLIRACRGEAGAARVDAQAGLAAAETSGMLPVTAWIRAALGFLELSLGNVAAAHALFAPVREAVPAMGVREPGAVRFLPDYLETIIALGQLTEAERLLGPFEERARALNRVWALATGARCRGLLLAAVGRSESAADTLNEALAHHSHLGMPLELGRTLLTIGRLHRRRKEKRLAKETLEEALAIFDGLGAKLWAHRVRTELGRVGLRPPSGPGLSTTEEQAAQLVAQGLTNRQIAERLFLSTRSVDGVIARVYQKLGVRSRVQLGAQLVGRVNKDQ